MNETPISVATRQEIAIPELAIVAHAISGFVSEVANTRKHEADKEAQVDAHRMNVELEKAKLLSRKAQTSMKLDASLKGGVLLALALFIGVSWATGDKTVSIFAATYLGGLLTGISVRRGK